MNTTIQHFDNLDLDTHIRVIEQDDQTYFVAIDICKSLGLDNTTRAVSTLDDDELTLLKVSAGGQNRSMNCVSESGLYALIFKSKKDGAKKFRKWVTSEVLPAIRQHGKYDPAELAAQMPPSVRRAYLLAQMEELEAEVTRLRAQADMAGVIPGQYTVFQWLLMQGEEPRHCGGLSGKCKRLAAERGFKTGTAKVIDHCGQITRLSRTAVTYPEEILKEVCGEAS